MITEYSSNLYIYAYGIDNMELSVSDEENLMF